MSETSDTRPLTPAPAHVEIRVGSRVQRIAYEQAFVFACSLIDQKQYNSAAQVFERLEQFIDRGPMAFIMHAFCEAALLHFDACSKPLVEAFNGGRESIAAELHNAFISYHVGIRQDALTIMAQVVNQHRDLPSLCLLLGNMFHASGQSAMARKCWTLAVRRDLPTGAIAAVARKYLDHLAVH